MSAATIDISDEIDAVRRLAETVRLAVHDPDLSAGDTAALAETLNLVIDRLKKIAGRVQAIVTIGDEVVSSDPAQVPEIIQKQSDLFDRRYADWVDLRAQYVKQSLEPVPAHGFESAYEAKHNELNKCLEEAARLAIVTFAPRPWMVWRKFEILDLAICGDGNDSDWADGRQLWMLGGIKADLLRLGIGDLYEA